MKVKFVLIVRRDIDGQEVARLKSTSLHLNNALDKLKRDEIYISLGSPRRVDAEILQT